MPKELLDRLIDRLHTHLEREFDTEGAAASGDLIRALAHELAAVAVSGQAALDVPRCGDPGQAAMRATVTALADKIIDEAQRFIKNYHEQRQARAAHADDE